MLRPDLPADVRERLVEQAKCLSCGYPLRGLDGSRCPECGRAFDLADLHSFYGPQTRMLRIAGYAERVLPWRRRTLIALSILMIWGGSAFVGGCALAIPAALALGIVLVSTSTSINVAAAATRRYAVVYGSGDTASLQWLMLFAVANLWLPITPHLLLGVPLSPFRAAVVRLYEAVPQVEAQSGSRWCGPMPIGPGRLQGGVFAVRLGYGYEAHLHDGWNGYRIVFVAYPREH